MSKSLDSYYFFSYLCTRIIEGLRGNLPHPRLET